MVGAVVLGLGIALSATPAQADDIVPAPASGSWTVEGRGWGHGIGMSQWGSQGAALQGLSAEQILDFYYPGTVRFDIGQNYPLRVRLTALAGQTATFGPVPGSSLVVTDLASLQVVTAPAGARVAVQKTAAGFTLAAVVGATRTPLLGGAAVVGPVDVAGAGGTQVWAYRAAGDGVRYPGSLRATSTGTTSLEVINHVPMEQYLRGVVPRESPSSWAPAALQAQSVAARSYALAVRAPSGTADLCDTTACQVYGGSASSTAGGVVTELYASTTDAAIAATARIARYYGGGPAFTQFSSSNGGYSKAGSRPYLVARPDPYSGTAPGDTRTRWTDTLQVSRVQASCPAGGTLRQMVLTRDGLGDLGGRILSARLDCSTGSATIATPAFGLLSSWWRPTSVGSPVGNFELAEGGVGTVRVKGWALDPDTTASTSVRVTFAGQTVAVVANLSRPDVANAIPGAGPLHGFDRTFAAPVGATTACVVATNVASGSDVSLGCRDVTVVAGAPFGSFDAATGGPGSPGPTVTVRGWVVDSEAPTAPVTVRVLVDGAVVTTAPANASRPDVGAALPGVGDSHGIQLTVPAAAGTREVCVQTVDIPSGGVVPLACRSVSVPGGSPRGNFESAVGVAGGVRVAGWLVDPDTTDPVTLRVQSGGTSTTIVASGSRADVAAAFPGYGPAHGFSAVIPTDSGSRTVCVTAVDVGAGSDVSLGCRTATVPGGSPTGNFEAATGRPGGVHLKGWALDPDTTTPIYVWVDTAGFSGLVRANVSRPDIGAAYPTMGPDHGFSTVVAVPPGQQTVCATAVNSGAGAHVSLGCRSVVVPGGSPVGNLEAVTATSGGIQVRGWALDPDTVESPYVWVEVDGRGQYLRANAARGDIARAFPDYGSAFGFSGTLAAAPGPHTVCVTAVNMGVGAHTLLRCAQVTVPAA